MKLTATQKETIIQWQRHFHQNPEVSNQEFQTAEKIREILSDLGIESKRIGKTGVTAEIRKPSSGATRQTLLLRADIDALPIQELSGLAWQSNQPGVMHACGHDGHLSALLGAAMLLQDAEFSGTVRLLFQPAEETINGALDMVTEGILEGVDRAAGLHFWPALPTGKIACEFLPPMAGCQHMKVKFFGDGGHISVPQLSHNPLLSAAQAFIQLQTIIPQQFSPFDNLLIGIGKLNGGTQYNIIPDTAVLDGTIRAFDNDLLEKMRIAIRNTVENIAAANYNRVELEFSDLIPPVINDREAVESAISAASAVVGAENVLTEIPRQFTGDDFSRFAAEVPAAYIKIGSFNPNKPETGNALHNPHFTLDEDALLIAAEFFTAYACETLKA